MSKWAADRPMCPVYGKACSTSYNRLKCRCDDCVEASRERDRRRTRDKDAKRAYDRERRLEKSAELREYDRARYHSDPSRKAAVKAQAAKFNNTVRGKEVRAGVKRRRRDREARNYVLCSPQLSAVTRELQMVRIPGYELDHVNPVCRGGYSSPWNLQFLSERDNRAKGGRPREVFTPVDPVISWKEALPNWREILEGSTHVSN